MSRVDKPALKGSWLGSLLVFLNPLVKLVLRTPLHWILDRWFLLLEWKGVKTGQSRSTPISYIRDDQGTWATTGDRWPQFVANNPSFRVRMRGKWQPAVAVVEQDAEASKQGHLRIFSEHGWFRFLAGIPKKNGQPDADAVANAIANGRKLVRIELDQTT
jgi:hypothetical protein